MIATTLRFGEVEYGDEDVILFPEGLVGLANCCRYLMLRDPTAPDLIWLQSLDQPSLSLATVHHGKLQVSSSESLSRLDVSPLGLLDPSEAEVFIVLNRNDGSFTANLRGPLVLNTERMLGRQVVLADPKWSTRHEIGPEASVLSVSAFQTQAVLPDDSVAAY